jgi:hypothetical protein
VTKKEALQVLAIMKAAYPSSFNGSKEELTGTVAVWALQFADMPADVVLMAVHKLISTSKFPPSIAEVKKVIEGLYWESYAALCSGLQHKTITEDEKRGYERLCDATESYRNGGFEIGVRAMIGTSTPLLNG